MLITVWITPATPSEASKAIGAARPVVSPAALPIQSADESATRKSKDLVGKRPLYLTKPPNCALRRKV
jgi:hypothetical protein